MKVCCRKCTNFQFLPSADLGLPSIYQNRCGLKPESVNFRRKSLHNLDGFIARIFNQNLFDMFFRSLFVGFFCINGLFLTPIFLTTMPPPCCTSPLEKNFIWRQSCRRKFWPVFQRDFFGPPVVPPLLHLPPVFFFGQKGGTTGGGHGNNRQQFFEIFFLRMRCF